MTTLAFRPTDEVDFVVIGAGAAGGVMAKELSIAGFRVVVLEQGPYLRESDYSHDELKYTILPGLTNDPKTQPVTYRKSEKESAKPLKAIEYGRQVGGGSVHFTGNYWRFHETDFHEQTLFGDVAGAALADLSTKISNRSTPKPNTIWVSRDLPEPIHLKAPDRSHTPYRRFLRSRQEFCSSEQPRNSGFTLSRRPSRFLLGHIRDAPRV
jgi:choline dehydrogenase-like flavoprotein